MTTFVNNTRVPASTYYRTAAYVPPQPPRPAADVRDDYERAPIFLNDVMTLVLTGEQDGTPKLFPVTECHCLFGQESTQKLHGPLIVCAGCAITINFSSSRSLASSTDCSSGRNGTSQRATEHQVTWTHSSPCLRTVQESADLLSNPSSSYGTPR
jgi:hypothetical protein